MKSRPHLQALDRGRLPPIDIEAEHFGGSNAEDVEGAASQDLVMSNGYFHGLNQHIRRTVGCGNKPACRLIGFHRHRPKVCNKGRKLATEDKVTKRIAKFELTKRVQPYGIVKSTRTGNRRWRIGIVAVERQKETCVCDNHGSSPRLAFASDAIKKLFDIKGGPQRLSVSIAEGRTVCPAHGFGGLFPWGVVWQHVHFFPRSQPGEAHGKMGVSVIKRCRFGKERIADLGASAKP